jgi:hypothetical protein
MDLTGLEERGWVAIPDVLSADSVTSVTARCRAILADKTDRRMGDKPSGGTMKAEEMLDRLPELRSLVDVPKVRAAAEHLLGGEAELHYAAFRLVNSGFGGQELHRDGVPMSPGDIVGVTCIAALCDVVEDNGPTAVVSGSHRWSPHEQRKLSTELLLGRAGTVFVFSSLLLHGGTRNNSTEPRPALQLFWKSR